jgi:hypothetical protein
VEKVVIERIDVCGSNVRVRNEIVDDVEIRIRISSFTPPNRAEMQQGICGGYLHIWVFRVVESPVQFPRYHMHLVVQILYGKVFHRGLVGQHLKK